jgi:hypothetical protein
MKISRLNLITLKDYLAGFELRTYRKTKHLTCLDQLGQTRKIMIFQCFMHESIKNKERKRARVCVCAYAHRIKDCKHSMANLPTRVSPIEVVRAY